MEALTDYTNARAEQVGPKVAAARLPLTFPCGNNKYRIPTPVSQLVPPRKALLPVRTMPLPGKGHSLLARDEYLFFVSLAQLDSWSDTPSLASHQVIPHIPRQSLTASPPGRLLV